MKEPSLMLRKSFPPKHSRTRLGTTILLGLAVTSIVATRPAESDDPSINLQIASAADAIPALVQAGLRVVKVEGSELVLSGGLKMQFSALIQATPYGDIVVHVELD